jgi:hypothetical protein
VVARLLGDLRDRLVVHFASEERPHGFLAHLSWTPDRDALVTRLRSEHVAFLERVAALEAGIGDR